MPELPEVEAGRKLAEQAFAGQRIAAVYTVADRIVYHKVPPRRLAAAISGRTVVAVISGGNVDPALYAELLEKTA